MFPKLMVAAFTVSKLYQILLSNIFIIEVDRGDAAPRPTIWVGCDFLKITTLARVFSICAKFHSYLLRGQGQRSRSFALCMT